MLPDPGSERWIVDFDAATAIEVGDSKAEVSDQVGQQPLRQFMRDGKEYWSYEYSKTNYDEGLDIQHRIAFEFTNDAVSRTTERVLDFFIEPKPFAQYSEEDWSVVEEVLGAGARKTLQDLVESRANE